MKILEMKNLKKPMSLALGDIVKLENSPEVEVKREYAKVIDASEFGDPCRHCVLNCYSCCEKLYVCGSRVRITALHPCTQTGELL